MEIRGDNIIKVRQVCNQWSLFWLNRNHLRNYESFNKTLLWLTDQPCEGRNIQVNHRILITYYINE